MNFGIAFSPLVPSYVLWGALALTLVLAVMLVLARSRGAAIRIGALALFVLALANPSLTREDRDPLSSILAVIVDKSPSQEFGDRTQQTEAARAQLASAWGTFRARGAFHRGRPVGRRNRRHAAVQRAQLGSVDVPRDRVAGAIMITDGRVHDVPATPRRSASTPRCTP